MNYISTILNIVPNFSPEKQELNSQEKILSDTILNYFKELSCKRASTAIKLENKVIQIDDIPTNIELENFDPSIVNKFFIYHI